MSSLRKTFLLLSAILWSTAICFSQISEANSQSNSNSSWNLHFGGSFSKLNDKTGRLLGTYSITFNKFATTPSADTMPLARILSPSNMYHDFGLGFERDDSQESFVRFYRVLSTGTEDEMNLTSFRQLYPWDHYMTGFVIILNETVNIDVSSFSSYVELSPEVKDLWTVSTTLTKIDPGNIYSPFDEFTSEYVASIPSDWGSFSILFLKISFERSETLTAFYSSWVPALAIFVGITVLLGSLFCFRRSNTISATVSGILVTGSVALFSIFLGRDPPPGTCLHFLFITDILLGIGSVVFLAFLATRHDEPKQFEHMNILREQVIEPWIALMRQQNSDTTLVSGRIEIEGSTFGKLLLNDRFHIEISGDPEFKYFKEFIEHLRVGYRKKFKQWTMLKEEWIRSLELAKRRIEMLQANIIERVTKETSLQNSTDRRSCESSTNLYFDSSRLAYLIYENISMNVKKASVNLTDKLSIIQTPGSSDVCHISIFQFPYLAQGSRQDCERILAAISELTNVSRHKSWMKKHEKTRQKLHNNLTDFLDFLEVLSKSVENKKMLRGRCELCS